MKRLNRFWLMSICAMACLLGAAHWLHTRPVYAQQQTGYYDDGYFYITGSIDVDNKYNLYADSYMEVEFDVDEDIDEIEVDGAVDKDGSSIASDSGYGDDDDPAEVLLESNSPVAPGHEYGVESDGYACYDDGEDDCDWEYVGSAYASVNLSLPTPQIVSLSTYSVTQGNKGTLAITGTNLVETSGDQLTINLAGSSAPFTSTGTPTSNTASFSYDFSSYPAGTYSLSVTNNEGTSNSETFTVSSQWQKDPCAVGSSPKTQYSSFVSSGTGGGSGTVSVSFSGSAYAVVRQAVSYGPYSTPSSIAANIAALITSNYSQHGLTARAYGPNIVYSGNSPIGSVTHAITGTSIATATSSTAESAAEMACAESPPSPPPVCGNVNPKYVLAVTHDSVVWKDLGMNNGRNVNYSLEFWPTTPNKLGAPTTFQSTVTEHLTARMAYGFSSPGTPNTGEFDDFLGSTAAFQSGTYTSDRCFTVTSPTLGNLGQVMSYDAAGKHIADHIQIKQSTSTSILNNWTNPDGSPKNIEIP